MSACRDCSKCCELGIVQLIKLPVRVVIAIPRGLWRLFFVKRCPQCGHPLKYHKRRADGSYAD